METKENKQKLLYPGPILSPLVRHFFHIPLSQYTHSISVTNIKLS